MKKVLLALIAALAFTSSIFAKERVLDITEVYPDPEAGTENSIDADPKAHNSLGFGLSVLGFELAYMNLKDHLEIDAIVACSYYSSTSITDISIGETTATVEDNVFIVTPKFCIGYNTLPGNKGWENTFGGFISVPTAFTTGFKDFGCLGLTGFYWRCAKNFNNAVEVGMSAFLPFVAGYYIDGYYGYYTIIQGGGAAMASLYTMSTISLDFKFYLN